MIIVYLSALLNAHLAVIQFVYAFVHRADKRTACYDLAYIAEFGN